MKPFGVPRRRRRVKVKFTGIFVLAIFKNILGTVRVNVYKKKIIPNKELPSLE